MKRSLVTKNKTNKLVLSSMMIALVFIATFVTKVPLPGNNYFNLGDGIIVFAGFLLGPIPAMISGAFGSALADYVGGYTMWIPITFIVKGLEGLVAGIIFKKLKDELIPISTFIAMLIMPIGYFLGEWLILSLVDKTLGMVSAISSLITNTVQFFACFILATILIFGLKRFKM